jgi:hypothetical protein
VAKTFVYGELCAMPLDEICIKIYIKKELNLEGVRYDNIGLWMWQS